MKVNLHLDLNSWIKAYQVMRANFLMKNYKSYQFKEIDYK